MDLSIIPSAYWIFIFLFSIFGTILFIIIKILAQVIEDLS